MRIVLSFFFSVVQLEFTPDIEILGRLFDRPLSNFDMGSLKQHTSMSGAKSSCTTLYFNFDFSCE